eukprot:CAMPEP_0171998934 /NCGR_PEP_ID=MMETSP1041-20130122/1505_1 /TAXON_ID=464988 /ORGANISM="Hemiselmis andersenii, Strain CCMP439" /LENGTH=521 /DNA_ID=CAMNT_0012652349 /DNA_START=20 /DNA_END=1585 /DNA_ORIENTATION=+
MQSQGFICPADGDEVCEIDNWSKSNLSFLVLVLFCIVIAVCIATAHHAMTSPDDTVGKPDGPAAHPLIATISSGSDADTADTVISPSSKTVVMPWSRINKVVRASSFAVVQLKNVDIAEGDNARLFEGVISAGVIARWARWVSEESTDDFHVRKKKDVAKAFVGVRSKFNKIESVSEHTVTTISQVVRHLSQVEGVLDWVIMRSTQDERILLAEIFKGLAEFHDDTLQTDKYANIIRPAWRPTMLWFALRSNAERIEELKTLLDSMIKYGQAKFLAPSSRVADGEPDEEAGVEDAPRAPGQNLGILNIIALADQKRKENAKFAQPSVFNEPSATEVPDPSRPEADAVFVNTLTRATSGYNLITHFPELPADGLSSPVQSFDREDPGEKPRSVESVAQNVEINARSATESKNQSMDSSVAGVASVGSNRMYGSSRRAAGTNSGGRHGANPGGRRASMNVRKFATHGVQQPAFYSFRNAVASVETSQGDVKVKPFSVEVGAAAGATLQGVDEAGEALAGHHAS